MRRTRQKKITVYKSETVITCDVCNCWLADVEHEDAAHNKGQQRLHIFASYGENVPHSGDTELFNITCDICDDCVEKTVTKTNNAKTHGEDIAIKLVQLAKLVKQRKPWERER